MKSTSISQQPTRRRRIGALATAGLIAAALAGGIGTNALYADQEVVEDNLFAAGVLDLTAGQVAAKLNITDMVPGQTETFDVTVGNAGSVDLRYALEGGFVVGPLNGQNLGSGLVLTVFDPLDVQIGTLAAGSGIGSTNVIFGNKTAGADAGDRTLAPAATETLTVQVTYPETADGTLAGADTELVLTFVAEQTANN